jgi:tetratricopeptide (TPR) repeat protein
MSCLANKFEFRRYGMRILLALAFAGLFMGCAKSDRDTSDPVTNPPVASVATPLESAIEFDEAEVEVDIDKSAEHLTRGNALLAEGKAGEAVEQFRLAAKFNPEDEDVFYNLGLAQARAGSNEAAKLSYQKSLEIYPDYVEAHNNLGNLLVHEGKFSEAIEHFHAALRNDDQHASTHNNLGTAFARQRKIADSLVHFQTAVELQPDYPEAQFNLGNAYFLLGRLDEAIAEYTRLLQFNPDFPKAREQLRKAKLMKNESPTAGQK